MIGRRSSQRSFAGTADWWLIGCWFVLVLAGFLNIYSTVHFDYPDVFVWESRACKQLLWIGTAMVMAVVLLFAVPSRLYENLSVPLYILMLGLLVLVIFIADDTKGSHSWLEFGSVKIQPCEFSKITTSLMLANVISKLDLHFTKVKDYLIAGSVLLLPMLAILGEEETGTMLVYVGFLFVLYREGISGWWLALLGAVIALFIITLRFGIAWSLIATMGVAGILNDFSRGRGWLWAATQLPVLIVLIVWTAVYGRVTEAFPESFICAVKPLYVAAPFLAAQFISYIVIGVRTMNRFRLISAGVIAACIIVSFSVDFVFSNVLGDHQQKRIEVLLGMLEDPSGWGYNVHQSKIAIGSGGLAGKGYLNGTQSTFGFVPEQSTDFIFCTVGEEWGFLGSVAVVLIYAFLIFRIVLDAEQSRSRFTRVYGYCVAACLFMHLVINVGMTIGLMPVIGIPLPLVSYGGSSMWGFTILIFIFVALDFNEKKYY